MVQGLVIVGIIHLLPHLGHVGLHLAPEEDPHPDVSDQFIAGSESRGLDQELAQYVRDNEEAGEASLEVWQL